MWETDLVALVDKLVSSRNCLQAVDVVELGGNLITKEPASATRTHGPRIDVFRIAPYQVTESTLMRNLLSSGDNPDLIDGPDLGAETAVDTKDGAVHNRSENQEIKHLATCLPNRCVAVLCLTFLVEPVYLRDLPGLVVSTDQDDAIGISVVYKYMAFPVLAERVRLTSLSDT